VVGSGGRVRKGIASDDRVGDCKVRVGLGLGFDLRQFVIALPPWLRHRFLDGSQCESLPVWGRRLRKW